MGTYRKVYYDGGNGACLGEVVELVLNEEGIGVLNDVEFGSRNDDGLLEDCDGNGTLLVPLD